MKAILLALAISLASASFANDFGAQLQVDLPLDPASITAFPRLEGYDFVSLSAFYEAGAYGARFDLLSNTEVQLGVYYRAFVFTLGSNGFESTIGVYGGYNWAGDGWFFRARGKFILYGSH